MKRSFSLILAIALIITMSAQVFATTCEHKIYNTNDQKTYTGTFNTSGTDFIDFSLDITQSGNVLSIKESPIDLTSLTIQSVNNSERRATLHFAYEILDTETDIIKEYIDNYNFDSSDPNIGPEAYGITYIESFPTEIALSTETDCKQIIVYLILNESGTDYIFGYSRAIISQIETEEDTPEKKEHEHEKSEIIIDSTESNNEETNPVTGAEIYEQVIKTTEGGSSAVPYTGGEKIVIIIGAVSVVALVAAVILMKKLK